MKLLNGFVMGVFLTAGVMLAVNNISTSRANQVETSSQFLKTAEDHLYSDEDLICLAENIYFESRGESLAGQLAVGIVTMNRVTSSEFPKSVCSVVKQTRYFEGAPMKNACQFSWYCDGHPDVIARNSEAWNKSVDIARAILEKQVYDFTNGATYFHARTVRPSWSRSFEKVAEIDNHIFYKPTL